MQNDLNEPLDQIIANSGGTLVSQLLQIQECRTAYPRSLAWAEDFACLSLKKNDSRNSSKRATKKVFSRTTIPIASRDYVAVSYRWEDDELYPDNVRGSSYYIDSTSRHDPRQSGVPDSILDRVVKYMDHVGVQTLWIDKDCINQHDGRAQNSAIQVMDLVYRCSDFPIGMLTTPVDRQHDLDALFGVVSGSLTFVKQSRKPRLVRNVSSRMVHDALRLLTRLMNDEWWTRRWTFQEEYCSYHNMVLMIPHARGLNKAKWNRRFDSLDAELLIGVAEFRKQVTLFCLACSNSTALRTDTDRKRLKGILARAKSYAILHNYDQHLNRQSFGKILSTRILADIGHRKGKKPNDTLAIIANCCGYTARLDQYKLEVQGQQSLSLAVLALFLLNGELIWTEARSSTGRTVSQFLTSQAFDQYELPVISQELTFTKRCRLNDVRFTEAGVETTGHLWRAFQQIRADTFDPAIDPDNHPQDRKDLCFDWLISKLEQYSNAPDQDLRQYLKHRAPPESIAGTRLEQVFDSMATHIYETIQAGNPLVIAQLCNDPGRWAVFVSDWDPTMPPMHIFTSFQVAEYSSIVEQSESPDKFMSLVVHVESDTDVGPQKLGLTGWINGLGFPASESADRHVFSWPPNLR